MAYINDFGKEIDSKRSGVILSDPRDTKTLYMRAYFDPDEEWASPELPLIDLNDRRRVFRGDPVVMRKSQLLASQGMVCGYDGTISHMYGSVAIVGIALADAVYDPRTHISQPIPVIVEGSVIVTVPAINIQNRDGIGVGLKGHYYAGEYISAAGIVDGDDKWLTTAQLVLGQIVAPKTDTPEATAIVSRLYKRADYDSAEYYHVPIRLALAPIGTAGYIPPSPDPERMVQARNTSQRQINANSIVQVNRRNNVWTMEPSVPGGFSNGVCRSDTPAGGIGNVQLTGVVTYVHNAMMDIISRSPRARSTPFGMRMLTRLQAIEAGGPVPNDDPLDDYVVGMGVTEDLQPIMTSVPGNKFGTIVDINKEEGSVTVQIDAIATHAPANTAVVDLSTDDVTEDTPVGTALIENPYTHRFVPCRCNTDNVDGILMEAEELVTVHGWGLADYRAFYGPGVWMDENGKIWRAFKSFAKGVYKRIIKPAAKWAISIAAPVAASYVGPLGEVIASHVSTKCGQLLDMIPPAQLQAAKNGGYMYTTYKGKQLPSDVDDPILQVFTDNAAHYGDSHPNATYVFPIDAPTANIRWDIGDAYTVGSNGKAVKITSYETPITGVANWEPYNNVEANAGWQIAGIHTGHIEKRTNALKIGAPVAYDYTDASERLAQGLATAIIGYVKEVWQPSTAILNDVKSGILAADNALPNAIIEVKPEYHYARDPAYKSIMGYEVGVQTQKE